MSAILLMCRLVLAAVFLVAGLGKLADRQGSRQALVAFGMADSLAAPLAYLVPLAELSIATALLPKGVAWWAAMAALVLLVAFLIGISANLARGRTPDCHCFGQLYSAPAGRSTLIRNVVLAGAAAFVVARGTDGVGPSAIGWISDLSQGDWAVLISALCAVLVVGISGLLLLPLLRQHGRLLVRLEELEGALHVRPGGAPRAVEAAPWVGLPFGARAPAFELNTIDGSSLSLDQLLAADKPVLLVFTEPQCVPCGELVPQIVRWQSEHAERLTIALISRGDRADNRHFADEGAGQIMLQSGREVAAAYHVAGSPGAVLIQANGSVAAAVALGSDAIHELVSQAVGTPGLAVIPQDGNGSTAKAHLVEAPGPGEPAPPFRLPDLTGAFFDLYDLRGSDTLLLFWNPGCAFCRGMLGELKAWEREHSVGASQLVLISTGGVQANRALALHSLILLDEEFGVARSFGAYGTPSAVLLDSDCNIASEVAVGGAAVLELARSKPMAAASS